MTNYKIIEHFDVFKSSLISYSLLGDLQDFPVYYDIREEAFILSKYFIKIINVNDESLIKNIYVFFDFNSAASFYQNKNNSFFKNSLLIITSYQAIPLVIKKLKKLITINLKIEFFIKEKNNIAPYYFLFEWIDKFEFYEFSSEKKSVFFKIKGEGIINSISFEDLNIRYFQKKHSKILKEMNYKISKT